MRAGVMIGDTPVPVPTPKPVPREGLGGFPPLQNILGWPDTALQWLQPFALASLFWMAKPDSGGVWHMYGPQWLKQLAGVGETLGWVRPENLPSHLTRQALKVNARDILGLIPIVYRDWKEAGGRLDSRFLATATVDSALHLVISKGFKAGGAALFGTLLAPVGLAPVGAAIGVVVGGVVGLYVEEWVRSTPIRSTLVGVTEGALNLGGAVVQGAAQAVDGLLDGAVTAITSVQIPDFRLSF